MQRFNRKGPVASEPYKITIGAKKIKRYPSEEEAKEALGVESFAGLSAEKMKELAVALCQTDKGLANRILSQMQQCTEARKAMVQACLQVCNQIMENCKEVESVTVIGYSRTLKALESQLTHEDISEGERESITEKMLSVMDEMKKYDEENKNFYREVLDKIAVGLLACADGSSHDENSSEDEPAGGTD